MEKIHEPEKNCQIHLPVLVINLDRSQTRWLHMREMLIKNKFTDVQRIQAIDGLSIDELEVANFYDIDENRKKYYVPLKKAEIACALSHRAAWRKIVEDNLDMACILEDDVYFEHEPYKVFAELQQLLKSNQPVIIRLYAKHLIRGKVLATIEKFRLVCPRLAPLGMVGTLVNKSAARKLLDFSSTLYEPIDVALQRQWDLSINSLVIQPNLIREISSNLGGTTLHSQEKINIFAKIVKETKRPLYRLKQIIFSYIY